LDEFEQEQINEAQNPRPKIIKPIKNPGSRPRRKRATTVKARFSFKLFFSANSAFHFRMKMTMKGVLLSLRQQGLGEFERKQE